MPAEKISLDQAKPDKLFYFVANAIVYRKSDGRCLVLKRHEREKVHPGKYGFPAGKIEWKDLDVERPTRVNGDVLDYEHALEDLLKREVLEEAGIQIEDKIWYIKSTAYIRPDGIPVMMLKCAATYKSGEIVLEEDAFTDYAWVNTEEIKSLPCIDGIPEEVAATIELFSSL